MSPSGFPGTIKPTRRAIPTPPLEHEPPPAPAHLSQQASFGRCFWFSNLKSRDSSIGRSPESSQPLSLSQGKFITSRILEVTANLLLSRLDNALTLAGQSALQSGDSQTHHHDALVRSLVISVDLLVECCWVWKGRTWGGSSFASGKRRGLLHLFLVQQPQPWPFKFCYAKLQSPHSDERNSATFTSSLEKPAASLLTWMSTPVLTFNLLTASQLNIVKVQYLDYPLHVLTGPSHTSSTTATSNCVGFGFGMDSVFSWPYRRLHFGSHLLGTPKLSPKCLKYNRCDVGSCRSWTGTGMIRVSQTIPLSSTLAFHPLGTIIATSGYTQRRWAHSIIVLRSKLQVCVDTRLFNAVVLALNFNARQQFHGQPQPQHRPNFNSTLLASPHFCLVPTFKPAPVFIRLSSSNSSGLGLGLHASCERSQHANPTTTPFNSIRRYSLKIQDLNARPLVSFSDPDKPPQISINMHVQQYTTPVSTPLVLNPSESTLCGEADFVSQRRRDGTRECAGTRRAGVLGSARRTCTAVGGRVLSARQRRLACSEQRAQRAQSIRRGQPSGEVPALSAARARGRVRSVPASQRIVRRRGLGLRVGLHLMLPCIASRRSRTVHARRCGSGAAPASRLDAAAPWVRVGRRSRRSRGDEKEEKKEIRRRIAAYLPWPSPRTRAPSPSRHTSQCARLMRESTRCRRYTRLSVSTLADADAEGLQNAGQRVCAQQRCGLGRGMGMGNKGRRFTFWKHRVPHRQYWNVQGRIAQTRGTERVHALLGVLQRGAASRLDAVAPYVRIGVGTSKKETRVSGMRMRRGLAWGWVVRVERSFAGPGAVKGQEEEVAVLQVSGSSLPRSVIFRVTRPFIHVPQQHPRPQKKSNWSGGISVGSEPSPGSNKCTEKNNNPGVLVTRAKIAPTMNAEAANKWPRRKLRFSSDFPRRPQPETPDSLEPAFWGPVLLL
ncbi:hypothetical protein C8R47DRAFT_1063771 [Mycena vitilis]|nr:hypothetical protein C8R47DRAFT_1063771 [Mycena vitilis]